MAPRAPATEQAFDFRIRPPSAPLDRYVESVWYARGTIDHAREHVAPTGSTVAILVLGDPIRQIADDGDGPVYTAAHGVIIGPHDRPIINEPLGETYAVGIVTTSIGCEATFGVRPAALRGRVDDLAVHWPAADALRAALLEVNDPSVMLDLVSHHGLNPPFNATPSASCYARKKS